MTMSSCFFLYRTFCSSVKTVTFGDIFVNEICDMNVLSVSSKIVSLILQCFEPEICQLKNLHAVRPLMFMFIAGIMKTNFHEYQEFGLVE